jgi:hypothetical protein
MPWVPIETTETGSSVVLYVLLSVMERGFQNILCHVTQLEPGLRRRPAVAYMQGCGDAGFCGETGF